MIRPIPTNNQQVTLPFSPKECLLNCVPKDVLLYIMQFCSVRELCRLELTSKFFKDLSRNCSPIWKQIYVTRPLSCAANSFQILQRLEQATVSYRDAYVDAMQISKNVNNAQWAISQIDSGKVRGLFMSNDVFMIEEAGGTLCFYHSDSGELQFQTQLVSEKLLAFVNQLDKAIQAVEQVDRNTVKHLKSLDESGIFSDPVLKMLTHEWFENPDNVTKQTVSVTLALIKELAELKFIKVIDIAASREFIAVTYNYKGQAILAFWDRKKMKLEECYPYGNSSVSLKLIGTLALITAISPQKQYLTFSFDLANIDHNRCVREARAGLPSHFIDWDETTLLGYEQHSIQWITRDPNNSMKVKVTKSQVIVREEEAIIAIYPDFSNQRFAVISQKADQQCELRMMQVYEQTAIEEKYEPIERGLWKSLFLHFGSLWMLNANDVVSKRDIIKRITESYPIFKTTTTTSQLVQSKIVAWNEKLFTWQPGKQVHVFNFKATHQEIVEASLKYYRMQGQGAEPQIQGIQLSTQFLYDKTFDTLTSDEKAAVTQLYLEILSSSSRHSSLLQTVTGLFFEDLLFANLSLIDKWKVIEMGTQVHNPSKQYKVVFNNVAQMKFDVSFDQLELEQKAMIVENHLQIMGLGQKVFSQKAGLQETKRQKTVS